VAGIRGLPPGRAGRLWLEHRLATAERGATLLDQKLRVLRHEHQRLRLVEERTGAAWEAAAAEAQQWSLRLALLEGRRAFRPPVGQPPVEVEVEWTSRMGVRCPAGASVGREPDDRSAAPPSSAALVGAVAAHRKALDAAVQHAVARSAREAVETELAATRRRARAIEERWVPRLRQALAELTLGLEELERADWLRLRWSTLRSAGQREERT
jgi:V/A-type H+-transporting ATPase subunit D